MQLTFIASLGLIFPGSLPLGAQTPRGETLSSIPLPPPLERVLRDYEKAWQARDAPALAALFEEHGFVLASGRLPVRGRAAIRAAYANSGGPISLRALAYATESSVGYIIGAYGHGEGSGDVGSLCSHYAVKVMAGGSSRPTSTTPTNANDPECCPWALPRHPIEISFESRASPNPCCR